MCVLGALFDVLTAAFEPLLSPHQTFVGCMHHRVMYQQVQATSPRKIGDTRNPE